MINTKFKNIFRHSTFALATLAASLAGTVNAGSTGVLTNGTVVTGTPVSAGDSTNPNGLPVTHLSRNLAGNIVANNAPNAFIEYYIPLYDNHAGVFGDILNVGDSHDGNIIGQFQDYGDGSDKPALSMYLEFIPADSNPADAILDLCFKDLDLDPTNDPGNFFETIQFFKKESLTTITPITGLIDHTNDENPSPNAGLNYTISTDINNDDYIHINFSDITSIISDPFIVKLDFTSAYNQNAYNTPEYLRATLETTPAPPPVITPIPIPSASCLGLLGFTLLATLRRRNQPTS